MRRKILRLEKSIACKTERNQIGAHFQCLLAFGFRIAVNSLVFPTIAQIAFVGIEEYQSTFIKYSEALSWFAIVLVNFW